MTSLPVILAIDDDPNFLEVISAKLSSKGFTVKTAKNGVEGVASAKALKPDLVLMDVQMPEKDGIEATIDLQTDPTTRGMKIIFLTNLGDNWPSVGEINRKFAQEIGAIDYFKKSGDLDMLIEKIRHYIGR
jgi:two-component system, OmpR family, alkaline phosphatase synthesis response regulator PhoP